MANNTRTQTLISAIIFLGAVAFGAAGCGGGGSGPAIVDPEPEIPIMPADDHGDSRADATVLPLGGSVAGEIEIDGDEDYFRVDVTEHGTLTVYTSGSLDTVGNLQAGDGTVLATAGDDGDERNFRIVRDVTPGTYYIRVGSLGLRVGSYVAHASFEADVLVLPPDQPDTPQEATTIIAGQTVEGHINSTDDVDYFRFEVSEPGTVTVTLDSEYAGIEVSLLDLEGNVLGAAHTESSAILSVLIQTASEFLIRIAIDQSVQQALRASLKGAVFQFALTYHPAAGPTEPVRIKQSAHALFEGICLCLTFMEPGGESKVFYLLDYIESPNFEEVRFRSFRKIGGMGGLTHDFDLASGRLALTAHPGAHVGIHRYEVKADDFETETQTFIIKVNVWALPQLLPGQSLTIGVMRGSKGSLVLSDAIGPPDNVGDHDPIRFQLNLNSSGEAVSRLAARIDRPPGRGAPRTLVVEPPSDLYGEFEIQLSAWFPDAEQSRSFCG